MLRQHRRILLGVGVIVAVQAAALGVYVLKRDRTPPPVFAVESLSPRAAPPLDFERSDRSTGSLESLRGKVVMVHFWATWCEPCRDELPGLLALAGQLEKTGRFELVAVSTDDEWDEIRQFFHGAIPRTAVRPNSPDAHRRFGASTLPDTYLLDESGELVVRYAGARDWRTRQAREHLERAIETFGNHR